MDLLLPNELVARKILRTEERVDRIAILSTKITGLNKKLRYRVLRSDRRWLMVRTLRSIICRPLD